MPNLQSKQQIFQNKKDLWMFNLAILVPNSLSIVINYLRNTKEPIWWNFKIESENLIAQLDFMCIQVYSGSFINDR